jgi:hypothetical protein
MTTDFSCVRVSRRGAWSRWSRVGRLANLSVDADVCLSIAAASTPVPAVVYVWLRDTKASSVPPGGTRWGTLFKRYR